MAILPQFPLFWLTYFWQAQTSYLSEALYGDLLARCRNHLLVKVAAAVDFSEMEKACAAYHHQSGPGCPASYPISSLLRAFLVGYLYDLSLRELEQRLYSDLLVRWFVGLNLFEAAPDHSTLERFHQWMQAQQRDLCFAQILQQIEATFPQERRQVQIGDTYAMRANTADENLVRRIRHVSQNLLVELGKALSGPAEYSLKGFKWPELFGVYPERLGQGKNDPVWGQRLRVTVLAADELHRRVERLLSNYSSQKYPTVRRWLGYLGKVLSDEVCITPPTEEAPAQVSELPQKEKGSFRLMGANDPEATLRVHGEEEKDITLGYNAQVAITPNGFIHETRAHTGARPDQDSAPELISAQIERHGNCPSKLIYDKAGGSGKTRAQVAEVSQGQCLVCAKLPDYEQRSQRFGPYDFKLSEDGKSLTCPGGKVSTHAYPSGSADGVNFRFYAFQCWNGEPPTRKKASREAARERRCPLWEQCRAPRQGNLSMRQVFISDYRDYVLAAQEYNQSEEFQADKKLRPRVERVIFELTHYNGARRCRRRGLANADFQAKMCAVAYNLKLWMRKLSRARKEPALAG